MPTITNKTQRPLSIPLPHGKKLFLGPGKTGEISPKAVDHPPVQKLVEAGEIEILAKKGRRGVGGGSTKRGGVHGSGGYTPEGGIRHTGDR